MGVAQLLFTDSFYAQLLTQQFLRPVVETSEHSLPNHQLYGRVVPSPGGGCDPIDHEVDGLSGPQLDALSQHMHELGNWRRQRTTKHSFKKPSYLYQRTTHQLKNLTTGISLDIDLLSSISYLLYFRPLVLAYTILLSPERLPSTDHTPISSISTCIY